MERQLRLAERQGLLRGRRLSEVQTFALELLHYADNVAEGKGRIEEIRLALVASGQYQPHPMLTRGQAVPVGVGSSAPQVVDSSTDPDAVEDYSEVEWESPSTQGEEEVAKDLEMFNQVMAQNAAVVVSEEGGEWL